MTFPKKEIKQNKEQVKSKLLELFNDANSWEEFCLKAQIELGVNVDTIFSKWKLGYMTLNYGKYSVFIPLFALLFITIVSCFVFLGVTDLLNPFTFILTIAAFICCFVSLINFNDFCDELAGIQYYC